MVTTADKLHLITGEEHERIHRHYDRAMPLLERHFGGTPLIAVTYPQGFAGDAVFHESFADLPKSIETATATTSSGPHAFVKLNAHNVEWLLASHFVVELDGWGSMLDDPQRAAFGRLVLSPHGSTTEDDVFAAAHRLGELLTAQNLQAISVLDGFRGLTLWIPFADGPSYDDVATWLRAFARDAAERHPTTFTVANLKAERGDRIYLGTKSNHPGMGTLLPYALRGTPALEVSLPVRASDLGKIRNGDVDSGSFEEYLKLFGDVFADERARIGSQHFGDRAAGHAAPARALPSPPDIAPHNYIIAAALAILADGDVHDANDILAQGIARGILPKSTTRKYVYTALHEYVVRTLGAGREPEFVQVADSASFRINAPADPWPEVALPDLPRWMDDSAIATLAERLRTTSVGADSTAFEVAVCEAFAALLFVAKHIGGNGQPDGVLAAPLGTQTYRVTLECKTSSPGGVVTNPRPEEPAKFRDAFAATKSVLVGAAFGGDASLDDELRTHGVALWTVDDLCAVLAAQIGPDELRPMFEAGRAAAALRSISWERGHGKRKRVAVIADRLLRDLWRTQVLFASVAAGETPVVDEDALFVLVDEGLARDGLTVGASLVEAREAIADLVARGLLRRVGDGFVAVVSSGENFTTARLRRSALNDPKVLGGPTGAFD